MEQAAIAAMSTGSTPDTDGSVPAFYAGDLFVCKIPKGYEQAEFRLSCVESHEFQSRCHSVAFQQ